MVIACPAATSAEQATGCQNMRSSRPITLPGADSVSSPQSSRLPATAYFDAAEAALSMNDVSTSLSAVTLATAGFVA